MLGAAAAAPCSAQWPCKPRAPLPHMYVRPSVQRPDLACRARRGSSALQQLRELQAEEEDGSELPPGEPAGPWQRS